MLKDPMICCIRGVYQVYEVQKYGSLTVSNCAKCGLKQIKVMVAPVAGCGQPPDFIHGPQLARN